MRPEIAVQQSGTTSAEIFRVGDLEVDPARATVTRDGVVVPLPPLSYDVLLTLVESAPALVTPDDMMKRVWAGVVVSPETIGQRIKLLRAALGDDARRPTYVAVVRGRGYRLIPAVQRVARERETGAAPRRVEAAGIATGTSADPVSAGDTAARRRRGTLRIAAALVAGAIVAALAYAWREAYDVRPERVALAAERSIAVLPFENVGGRTEDAALATGVAEAVLHRLASLPEMIVIARTSSFAVGSQPVDAREIGRRLGARYLLQGSLQRDGDLLRVTTQLIDAESGTHLWSLRLDRAAEDVFRLQDEIAARVADALSVSLDTPAAGPTPRPRDFDAYLEYLQARSLLAGANVAQLPGAIEALERAIARDPDFAPAYVALANARLQQAEFEVTPARRAAFDAAVAAAESLANRALALEPTRGDAHLVRAKVLAFTDLAAAEVAYREGLRLAPSDASGYEGLASVLYQDPRRRDEALALLERARRLSPLDPRFDVTKAVFLLYGRSDREGAGRLLLEALQKQPLYPPALARLGELQWLLGRPAEAVRHLEQALKLDPRAEWALRVLVLAYLDLGDEPAARDVIAKAPQPVPIRELPLALYRREWARAAELAYEGYDSDTVLAVDESLAVFALRQAARDARERREALQLLEEVGGVSWDAEGRPIVEQRLDMKSAETGVADLLALDGQPDRARRLAARVLEDVEFEAKSLKRGDLWYFRARPLALALTAGGDAVIAELERLQATGAGRHIAWLFVLQEPRYRELRARPAFARLAAELGEWRRREREALAALRRSGSVPVRPSPPG
jgi:TolB-like protein/DNA-binding winged helix-turn-helix (wHTH) protein/Tfp pilus assembly protein PilF